MWIGIIPFIALHFVVILLIVTIPELVTWLPDALLNGLK
jgi:TRAP-type mannitol/chloroaromatic compound transport system permease large subunit